MALEIIYFYYKSSFSYSLVQAPMHVFPETNFHIITGDLVRSWRFIIALLIKLACNKLLWSYFGLIFVFLGYHTLFVWYSYLSTYMMVALRTGTAW